ncbi:beta-1,4-galactosyltransferase 6 [Sinocyclocheilus grahami]|uniref:beta-1,4-galactosyltransferase 6 n=1 Tax=Sinocyclocheilus grahami TaxID=75366 RepID=UPI0007AC9104|nr:PREDICTED: beta-1,4-galactosyltransferase 6-like [Sinocyclocheilus grahami]
MWKWRRLMRLSNRSLMAFIFFFSMSTTCLYFIYVAPGIVNTYYFMVQAQGIMLRDNVRTIGHMIRLYTNKNSTLNGTDYPDGNNSSEYIAQPTTYLPENFTYAQNLPCPERLPSMKGQMEVNMTEVPVEETELKLKHLDIQNVRLPYNEFFGGVSGLTVEQFLKINGFPNAFWGWGGEDDDLWNRVHYAGFNVTRPEGDIGKYKSIPHHHRGEVQFLGRYKLLRYSKERQHLDGLNNLQYSPEISLSSLYKNITVNLNPELAPIAEY